MKQETSVNGRLESLRPARRLLPSDSLSWVVLPSVLLTVRTPPRTPERQTPIRLDLANASRLLAGVFTELEGAVSPVRIPKKRATEGNRIGNVGETELDVATLDC